MSLTLKDILARTSRIVVTLAPDRTLRQAVQTLCEHRIGAVVVASERGDVVGILSERDLMRQVAARVDLDGHKVEDAMTRDVIVGLESDSLGRTMDVMTEHRIRHLPVMRDGKLVGIVSIGDVVNEIRLAERQEARYLKDYVQGRYW